MEETSRKYVIITGFGPFNGVSANPTEVLIQRLQQDETDLDIHYHVLPVSVDAVDGFHGSLDKEALVYIHLGVNGSATAMHLERYVFPVCLDEISTPIQPSLVVNINQNCL